MSKDSRSLGTTTSQSFLHSFFHAKKLSKVVYESLADWEPKSHETIV